MALSSFFEGMKSFFKTNFISRITGIIMRGTLGQKVAVVIGCLFILFGIYKAFHWILLSVAGYLIVFLAFKDNEKLTLKSSDP